MIVAHEQLAAGERRVVPGFTFNRLKSGQFAVFLRRRLDEHDTAVLGLDQKQIARAKPYPPLATLQNFVCMARFDQSGLTSHLPGSS